MWDVWEREVSDVGECFGKSGRGILEMRRNGRAMRRDVLFNVCCRSRRFTVKIDEGGEERLSLG